MPRTRKNAAGECVDVAILEKEKVLRRTQKAANAKQKKLKSKIKILPNLVKEQKVKVLTPILEGEENTTIVPKQPSLEEGEIRSTKKSATPRTIFAKKYFDQPVMLLNEYKGEPWILFQVSFKTPDQFTNYANLSANPKIDCAYQSLFSMGLRDVETAKKDSIIVNEKGTKGVYVTDQTNYLTSAFQLNPKQIKYVDSGEIQKEDGTADTKGVQQQLDALFKEKMKDNHVTMFHITFWKYGKEQFSHAMVAYKYKNRVHYFDPQQKGLKNEKLVKSKTLAHIIKYSGNNYLSRFGYFMVEEMPEPIPPTNISCELPYVG